VASRAGSGRGFPNKPGCGGSRLRGPDRGDPLLGRRGGGEEGDSAGLDLWRLDLRRGTPQPGSPMPSTGHGGWAGGWSASLLPLSCVALLLLLSLLLAGLGGEGQARRSGGTAGVW
jgi:hypothetical protein